MTGGAISGKRLRALLFFLPFFPVGVAALEPVNILSTTVNSDNLYHGITESSENPSIGLRVEQHFNKNWFAGINFQASRADRTIERHRGTTSYIGFEFPVTGNGWLGSFSTRYRKFFASNKEWDYFEYSAQLHHTRGFSLNIDFAPDYYAHNTRALVTQASQYIQLNRHWYAIAGLGYASFNEETEDYQFARMVAGLMLGRTSMELQYNWHNLDSRRRFRDPVQSDGIRLSISHRWH